MCRLEKIISIGIERDFALVEITNSKAKLSFAVKFGGYFVKMTKSQLRSIFEQ